MKQLMKKYRYRRRVEMATANQTLDNCINGNAFHSSSWWSKRSWSGRSNMAFIARLRQWRWDDKAIQTPNL